MKTKSKKIEIPSIAKSTSVTSDDRVNQILEDLVNWSLEKKQK